MKVGIDGDIIIYQSAFALESRGYIGYDENCIPITFSKYKKNIDPLLIVVPHKAVELDDLDSVISIYNTKVCNILRKVGTDDCTIYLTGKDNFRNDIYPAYKSSRGAKPLLYTFIRDYAESFDNAVVVNGQEADDALSIAQYKDPKNHIIATIDKDLLMVPGLHYNPNKDSFMEVTEEEGLRTFYKQILTGDDVDDIPGIKGIGPKKAEKILKKATTEVEMWEVVLDQWEKFLNIVVDFNVCMAKALPRGRELDNVLRNELETKVTTYARLLYMRTKEDEIWNPPTV